jgi:mono/diheme cytochrome c family protein
MKTAGLARLKTWARQRLRQRLQGRAAGVAAAVVCMGGLVWAGLWAVPVAGQQTRQSPPYDAAEVTVPASLPLAISGRALYQENCAPCHGEQGLGNGPASGDLPGPATAFADRTAVWERSPGMLFHTTKFGRLEKLMPPWSNRLTDTEIWDTVAFAWSLHTKASETTAGGLLYNDQCASCHGLSGAGDGPEAVGSLPDFTDLGYTLFVSQADWQQGWEKAHNESGAEWSQAERENVLEYLRTFSYVPPWGEAYRPGDGLIAGEVRLTDSGPQQIEGADVRLQAYLGFEAVATFTTTLGADRRFTFTDLSVDPALLYLATVQTDEGTYSSAMVSLSAEERTAEIPITLYGTTDSPEAVRINQAHWILEAQPGALVLAQIYLFGNSEDRTFVGRTVEGVDRPVTAAVEVPEEAVNLSFQNGTLGDRFRRVGNQVYDTLPVPPGESSQQIVVQYVLPADGSALDLRQELLYPVDSLSLLVANFAGLRVDAPAMTFDSVQNIQGAEYQLWNLSDFGPGPVEVKLQGLPELGAVDSTGAQAADSELSPVGPPLEGWVSWAMLGLVAAAVLGVAGVAIQRGAFARTTVQADLRSAREQLLTELALLDDRHAQGQLPEGEWLRQRAATKARLLDLLRRLERS